MAALYRQSIDLKEEYVMEKQVLVRVFPRGGKNQAYAV